MPLLRRDPNGSPQPQPEQMVARGTVQGHRWSIAATSGEGAPGACALLRLDGQQLSVSCGYTETPPLPRVRSPACRATRWQGPPVPGLPGKFFYLISPTRLGLNYGVALLDPQGRPVAI
jgi:hypothetical protein